MRSALSRFWPALVAVGCAVSAPCAIAKEFQVGQHVFWTLNAKFTDGSREVDLEEIPFPAIVRMAEGDRLWLGKAWLHTSDALLPDEALVYYDKVVQLEPTPSAYNHRGIVWHELGKLDCALEDMNKSIELDPTNSMAWNSRAALWESKGEFDNANRDYTEAIRLDPENQFAYYNRALAWHQHGDVEKALPDYTEAIQIDPNDADAYNNRGAAWKDKGELTRAIDDFTQAIRLDPDYALAYTNRGDALHSQGEYAAAIRDFREAIRADEQLSRAQYLFAWVQATCPDAQHRDGEAAIMAGTRACELTRWTNGYFSLRWRQPTQRWENSKSPLPFNKRR